MESLQDDEVPVLRVSYEQLCERLQTRNQPAASNDDRIKRDGCSDHYLEDRANRKLLKHNQSTERKDGRKVAANILKQTLESSRKNNTEKKVWEGAWSKWTRSKEELDATLAAAAVSGGSTFFIPKSAITQW